MITPAFIWLLVSHISVFFPVYIGVKINYNKWKSCILILILNSFFSCVYHWVDQDNHSDNFVFLGTDHFVHTYMDYYCSFLSFFIVTFYTFNLNYETQNIDFYLTIINIICVFMSLISGTWYSFMIIIITFMLGYMYLNRDQNWKLILIVTKKKIMIILTILFLFILAMIMQYRFCALYGRGFYYHIYHGIWHFTLFLASGFCMIFNHMLINEKLENNLKDKKICCYNV